MFCSSCRAQIQAQLTVCPNCHRPVPSAAVTTGPSRLQRHLRTLGCRLGFAEASVLGAHRCHCSRHHLAAPSSFRDCPWHLHALGFAPHGERRAIRPPLCRALKETGMKVLILGAGVVGSFNAVRLGQARHDAASRASDILFAQVRARFQATADSAFRNAPSSPAYAS